MSGRGFNASTCTHRGKAFQRQARIRDELEASLLHEPVFRALPHPCHDGLHPTFGFLELSTHLVVDALSPSQENKPHTNFYVLRQGKLIGRSVSDIKLCELPIPRMCLLLLQWRLSDMGLSVGRESRPVMYNRCSVLLLGVRIRAHTSGRRWTSRASALRHCSTTQGSFLCHVFVLLFMSRTLHIVSMQPLCAPRYERQGTWD